ncbi:DUF6090 family protein [Maribacter arenosus]|uniref:Uncharacterized protein n=1 Tax=Maribacter arenosus TaxID=1854708 RepID=A0ABR7VEE9_9FLAO|nr:DUF6090 family protein [Maribacter arenosus]MBD0852024.1 hypothetical protein [Maribacter arenosus]
MIKFFRRIRQQLLTENKPALPAGRFSKYLLYAIGEIILVVIGILIALQINNWNEDQKKKALERNMLENLVENLEQNCDRLKSRIQAISYYRESGSVIISAIENKLNDQDSLENYFHFALMNTSNIGLSETGYNVIKNNGFEIIRNQALKNEMMVFFEEIQPHLLSDLSWGTIDMADREKFIDENFIQIPNDKGITYKPFDLESLLSNHYFIALVRKTDAQRSWFSIIMQRHLKESQRMLEMIKIELNK